MCDLSAIWPPLVVVGIVGYVWGMCTARWWGLQAPDNKDADA